MPTRFYLPASGTAPLPALEVDTGWDRTDALVRRPMFTQRTGTALATDSRSWATAPGVTRQWCFVQFQSESLVRPFLFSVDAGHQFTFVVGKCGETATTDDTLITYCIRLVDFIGTVKGALESLVQVGVGGEFPLIASAATRIRSGGSAVIDMGVQAHLAIELY